MPLTNAEPVKPDREAMSQALRTLRDGGVVAFPTETVYGLGAAISSERAVNTIFDLKHRPRSRPLLAHVSSVEMARSCASVWPKQAEDLAQRFWPGPLTLVLPKSDRVQGVVVADGSTVGLRCPAHPVALELIESLGEPIAGTSANPTGQAPATLPGHVRDAFEPDCVFLLDAGRTPGGLESTVVLLGETAQEARILRLGPIGATELGIEPESSIREGAIVREEAIVPASGSMNRVRVVESGDLQRVTDEIHPAAIITHHPERIDSSCLAKVFVLPADAGGYSRKMYATLYEAAGLAGEQGWVVVVRPDESGELWQAIVHRLERFDLRI